MGRFGYHFRIYRNDDGKYVAEFRYRDEVIFATEACDEKKKCRDAIEVMKIFGPKAPVADQPK